MGLYKGRIDIKSYETDVVLLRCINATYNSGDGCDGWSPCAPTTAPHVLMVCSIIVVTFTGIGLHSFV
jgi:hypothetical protein